MDKVIRADYNDNCFVDKQLYSLHKERVDELLSKADKQLKDAHNYKGIIIYNKGHTYFNCGVLTTRGTIFVPDIRITSITLDDGEESLQQLVNAFSQEPIMEKEKEQFTGVYLPLNKTVTFNREFSGYRFTDKECEDLLKGEYVAIKAVNRHGEEQEFIGRLSQCSYMNYIFWGYKLEGRLCPRTFANYTFSDSEYSMLLKGIPIIVGMETESCEIIEVQFHYSPKTGLKEKLMDTKGDIW